MPSNRSGSGRIGYRYFMALVVWGGLLLGTAWPGWTGGDRSLAEARDVEGLLQTLQNLRSLADNLKQNGNRLDTEETLLRKAQARLQRGDLEVAYGLLFQAEEGLSRFGRTQRLASYEYNSVRFEKVASYYLGRSVSATLAIPLITGSVDHTDRPGAATVALDRGFRYPAVVLLHGAGQRVDDLLFLLYDLARHGYVALAMDFHWHYHKGYLDVLRFVDYVAKLPLVDADRLGLISFSGGSHYGLRVLQKRPNIRCWISFYGIFAERPLVAEDVTPLTCHTLILHGNRDKVVPVQTAYAMEALLRQTGKPYMTRFFPEQRHGFRGQSAREAYRLSLDFLATHLRSSQGHDAASPTPISGGSTTHQAHE